MEKTISSILLGKAIISELSTHELNSFIEYIIPEINKLSDEEFEIRQAQKKQVHINAYLKQCETAIEIHKQKCEQLRAAYISLSIKQSHSGLKNVRGIYRRLRHRYQMEATRDSKPIKPIEEWEIAPVYQEPLLIQPKLTESKSLFSVEMQRTIFGARNHYMVRLHKTKYRAEKHARQLRQLFLSKAAEHDESSHSVTTVLRSIDANLEAVNELFANPPSHGYIWEDAFQHYAFTILKKMIEYEGTSGIVQRYNNSEHTWSLRNSTVHYDNSILSEINKLTVVPSLRRLSGPDINTHPYGDKGVFTATTGEVYVPSSVNSTSRGKAPAIRGCVSMGNLLGQYPLGFEAYQAEFNINRHERPSHFPSNNKSSGSSVFVAPSPVKPLRVSSISTSRRTSSAGTFPRMKSEEGFHQSAAKSSLNHADVEERSQFTALALKMLAETTSISSSNYDDLPPLQSQGKPSSLGSIFSRPVSCDSSESIFRTEAYELNAPNLRKLAREQQPMNSIEKMFIHTDTSTHSQLSYTNSRKLSGGTGSIRNENHAESHYPLQPLEDN